MKKNIEVEIFTDQGNNAVLKMPERRYPGVLIQGDSLGNLSRTADAILALSKTGGDGLTEEIELLAVNLRDIYLYYVSVLKENGIDFY